MADTLEQMFANRMNRPGDVIGQQMSYLKDMNRLPTMSISPLPIGMNGQYNNWGNTLQVSPLAASMPNTFAHELQHAMDAAYAGHAASIKKKTNRTAEEQQFLDAYKKLEEPTKMPLGDMDSYRGSTNERQAFGVANMNYPFPGAYQGSPHIDATEATEQAIKYDLARRALNSAAVEKEPPKVDYIDAVINPVSDWAQSHINTIRNLFK